MFKTFTNAAAGKTETRVKINATARSSPIIFFITDFLLLTVFLPWTVQSSKLSSGSSRLSVMTSLSEITVTVISGSTYFSLITIDIQLLFRCLSGAAGLLFV